MFENQQNFDPYKILKVGLIPTNAPNKYAITPRIQLK